MKDTSPRLSDWSSMAISLLLHGLLLFGLGAWVFEPSDFAMKSGEGGMPGMAPDPQMEVVVEIQSLPPEEKPVIKITEAEDVISIPEPIEEKLPDPEPELSQPEQKPKPESKPAPKPVTPQKQQVATGSGGVHYQAKPNYLRNPAPRYPSKAKRLNQQGLVTLNVWIKPNGRVERLSLRKSSGYSLLDEQAKQSVKRWVFKPARVNGIKVATRVVVPIRFELK